MEEPVVVPPATFLLECLFRAGMRDVVTVEPAAGGLAALAGIATRREGPPVFVKAFVEAPADDVFTAEAEGLAALRELGGATTPEVILADRELLVLSVLRPRPRGEAFWERFAHMLAHLHTKTTHPRFGWHRDNWLGAAGRSTRGTTTVSRSSPSTGCFDGSGSPASTRRSTGTTGPRWSGCVTGCPTCCHSGRHA